MTVLGPEDPLSFLATLRQRSEDLTNNVLQASARKRALANRIPHGFVNTQSNPSGPMTPAGGLEGYAQQQLSRYGWNPGQWQPLFSLWQKESGWNPTALNKSSGAYGIPQALPSNKLPHDRMSTGQEQIDWGLNYIKQRYGSPAAAWAHSQQTDWY